MPKLNPGNWEAWNLYQVAATQFAYDFHVDILGLMDRLGITRPEKMLEKLALIHRIAQDNRERYGERTQDNSDG